MADHIIRPTKTHITLPTRREALIGFGSAVATTSFVTRANAAPLGIWGTIAAGVAAAWLFEWLKSLGLVPGTGSGTVASHHERKTDELRHEGYRISPRYSGTYSRGDFALSEARRGDELLALGTSDHRSHHADRSICSIRFDTADVMNLGLVARALRDRGHTAREVEESILPLHPSVANRFEGGRRLSPNYLTPSGGSIAWSTDIHASRPNLVTTVRSPVVSRQFEIELADAQWRVKSRQV